MDILQTALVIMVTIVCIFLVLIGVQLFIILKDLKKALDKMNNMLATGEGMISEIGKPMAAAAKLVSILGIGTKIAPLITKVINKVMNKKDKYPKVKVVEK